MPKRRRSFHSHPSDTPGPIRDVFKLILMLPDEDSPDRRARLERLHGKYGIGKEWLQTLVDARHESIDDCREDHYGKPRGAVSDTASKMEKGQVPEDTSPSPKRSVSEINGPSYESSVSECISSKKGDVEMGDTMMNSQSSVDMKRDEDGDIQLPDLVPKQGSNGDEAGGREQSSSLSVAKDPEKVSHRPDKEDAAAKAIGEGEPRHNSPPQDNVNNEHENVRQIDSALATAQDNMHIAKETLTRIEKENVRPKSGCAIKSEDCPNNAITIEDDDEIAWATAVSNEASSAEGRRYTSETNRFNNSTGRPVASIEEDDEIQLAIALSRKTYEQDRARSMSENKPPMGLMPSPESALPQTPKRAFASPTPNKGTGASYSSKYEAMLDEKGRQQQDECLERARRNFDPLKEEEEEARSLNRRREDLEAKLERLRHQMAQGRAELGAVIAGRSKLSVVKVPPMEAHSCYSSYGKELDTRSETTGSAIPRYELKRSSFEGDTMADAGSPPKKVQTTFGSKARRDEEARQELEELERKAASCVSDKRLLLPWHPVIGQTWDEMVLEALALTSREDR